MSFIQANNYDTVSNTVTATGWTPGAGSNRAVLIIEQHEENSNAKPMTALSFGGVSATPYQNYASGLVYVSSWVIFESSISSIASNPVITFTPSGSPTNSVQAVTVFVFSDAKQDTTGWTYATDTDTAANALNVNLSAGSGWDVVGGLTQSTGGNSVNFTNVTEVTGSDRNFNGTLSRAGTFYGSASGSTINIIGDSSSTSGSVNQTMLAIGIQPYSAASNPTITSTSDDTPTNGTNLTITGTNFGSTQGSGSVTLGGTSITPSYWSDTSIVIPIVLGDRLYNSNYSIVVTNNSSLASSGHNIQIQPASGYAYTNLSGTLATSGNRLTSIPDLASGDQVEYYGVVGGTISDVVVYSDGSIAWSTGVTGFYARANDGTGWGTAGFQDTSAMISTPSTRLYQPIYRNIYRNIYTNIGM